MFDGLGSSPKPKIAEIQQIICATYGLSLEDLKGPSRKRHIAWPRQDAFALCRELTACSYPQIGHAFGGRDHTTVLFGEKQAKVRVGRVPDHAAVMAQCRAKALEMAASHPPSFTPATVRYPCRAFGNFPGWTAAEDAILKSMWAKDANHDEISERLGTRTPRAVSTRAYKLGLEDRRHKKQRRVVAVLEPDAVAFMHGEHA